LELDRRGFGGLKHVEVRTQLNDAQGRY
jgi:hypothetical protein